MNEVSIVAPGGHRNRHMAAGLFPPDQGRSEPGEGAERQSPAVPFGAPLHMAERRVPLGDAIPKMTYRIQACVSVVELVQQLWELIEHETARRLTTGGKPIPGLRPTCLLQHRQKTEALLRHLHGSSEMARPVGMRGPQSPASPLTRSSSISDNGSRYGRGVAKMCDGWP